MTLDYGASSNFVDSHVIGDFELRMKNIVKIDPSAKAQGFLLDMLLPAMDVPGPGRHLFSGGTTASKGVNTIIAKESYLDVGQFKISLRKDTDYLTIDYLDFELAPRENY